MVLVLLGSASTALALTADARDVLLADAMRLLGARTYVASASNWCSLNIADDPALAASVQAWQERNRTVNDRALQVIEAVGGLSPERRAEMNRMGDQVIRRDIEHRPDPRAFCRDLPGKLDSGVIDMDKRDDLRGPLERVFAYPLPKS
ncbi:MAG TPA: hypothetical protein PKA13_09825 [Geminicoccaceae bacterium]|nr:hypothetical protein [Geminicoccus sp.]HMU50065.1 hypothetical protein [Geminicoccaceae bacterium]